WSLRGGYLHMCPPRWVDCLRSGAVLMVCALPWLWLPIGWVVFAVGLWRLSAPDPGRAGASRWGLMRGLVRFVVTAFGALAVGGPLTFAYLRPSGLGAWWPECLAPGWALVQVLTALTIDGIARRSDSQRLRRLRVFVLRCGGVAFFLTCPWAVAMGTGVASTPGSTSAPTDLLAIAFGVGVLALVVNTVPFVLMLQMGRRVLDVAEVQARATRRDVRAWGRVPRWRAAPAEARSPDASGSPAPGAA
ncbi:MAG TPA: hypothetical protein VGM03_06520, partial [Phycisphaerae bacterium]